MTVSHHISLTGVVAFRVVGQVDARPVCIYGSLSSGEEGIESWGGNGGRGWCIGACIWA